MEMVRVTFELPKTLVGALREEGFLHSEPMAMFLKSALFEMKRMDTLWDETFAATIDKLRAMSDKALEDMQAGRTKSAEHLPELEA